MQQLLAAAEPVSRPQPFYFWPKIAAGFPSPAMDFEEGILDISEYLIRHPSASFWFRAGGWCLKGAGVHDGDLILVDSAVSASDRAIVLAKLDGEYTLKRYRKVRGRVWLEPDPVGEEYPKIEIPDGVELEVFGVMTSLVRTYF